jgi:dTMP kinase
MPYAEKALFITLEGGEGAGKSTLGLGLKEKLEQSGRPVLLTREPGGTPNGEEIRKVLLAGIAQKMGPMAEALLFASARDEHLKQIIRPALQKNQTVICDRFSDSTRAYQGYVGGAERALIERLDEVVVGDTKPNLTFIIDIPAEVGLARVKLRAGRTDRFENEELDFHRRLRAAYIDISQRFPERCIVLDGLLSPETVLEKAWNALAQAPAFAQN